MLRDSLAWRLDTCICKELRCGETNRIRKEHSEMIRRVPVWIKSSCARSGKACDHNLVGQGGQMGTVHQCGTMVQGDLC